MRNFSVRSTALRLSLGVVTGFVPHSKDTTLDGLHCWSPSALKRTVPVVCTGQLLITVSSFSPSQFFSHTFPMHWADGMPTNHATDMCCIHLGYWFK
jgi:hypothetical protein